MTLIKDNKKTVLITGASSGIGYELSKVFAKHGYNLILVARSIEKLDKLRNEIIQKYGVGVSVIQKDLSINSSAEEVFNEVNNENIQVDILVNNAGAGVCGEFHEIDYRKDIEIIQLNITSLTILTKLFSKKMIKNGYGKILNVASTGAYQPGPYIAVYYATKAYVLSLSEALTNELGEYGITVSTLCPGSTRTNFSKSAGKAEIKVAMDAKEVAISAYNGLMKSKRVIIPGINNKLAIFLSKLVPGNLSAYFVKKIQKTLYKDNMQNSSK
ncbi:SDR family NAD(P)-dependent oxidoreductase [Clostridium botulinum]|uniref:Short-chain dehydrogenase n=1 Tax=Clostridium botulinum TaxID=1491 RepID=A0A9Q1ZCN3_CLOBO|nr:SDR family oxidoreductase [Clostridium botulinum]AEB76635.1 probable short-chain dehydrogenase [Clostridium botulinum BKT015925]KEI02949.1 short-chain dehydrogenase [Clostridium botulinum D str. 16868]KEI03042.1 short-chain dehydrogenase [Clostridium botulinum C/D str. Sp77]KLU76188.1 short-chain dehydrogenase [Clostridium botulinum V891]KOA73052.1 short-chain dehydrogenase [Clostridium botulinum]